ncbi:uncharacterized protein METZ01_LOCUS310387, partial [marine metagenome]
KGSRMHTQPVTRMARTRPPIARPIGKPP